MADSSDDEPVIRLGLDAAGVAPGLDEIAAAGDRTGNSIDHVAQSVDRASAEWDQWLEETSEVTQRLTQLHESVNRNSGAWDTWASQMESSSQSAAQAMQQAQAADVAFSQSIDQAAASATAGAGSVEALAAGVGVLTAVITAAVVAALSLGAATLALEQHFAATSMRAGEAAQMVGTTSSQLTAMEAGVTSLGGQSDHLQQGLMMLSMHLKQVAVDGGAASPVFGQLGITIDQSNIAGQKSSEILLQMADKFRDMPDGIQKTSAAQEAFGRSGGALIPILNLGRDAMQAAMDRASALGLTVTDADVAMSKAFEASEAQIEQYGEAFLKVFERGIMPIINQLLVAVRDNLADAWNAFTGAMGGVQGATSAVTDVFSELGHNIDVLWQTSLPALQTAADISVQALGTLALAVFRIEEAYYAASASAKAFQAAITMDPAAAAKYQAAAADDAALAAEAAKAADSVEHLVDAITAGIDAFGKHTIASSANSSALSANTEATGSNSLAKRDNAKAAHEAEKAAEAHAKGLEKEEKAAEKAAEQQEKLARARAEGGIESDKHASDRDYNKQVFDIQQEMKQEKAGADLSGDSGAKSRANLDEFQSKIQLSMIEGAKAVADAQARVDQAAVKDGPEGEKAYLVAQAQLDDARQQSQQKITAAMNDYDIAANKACASTEKLAGGLKTMDGDTIHFGNDPTKSSMHPGWWSDMSQPGWWKDMNASSPGPQAGQQLKGGGDGGAGMNKTAEGLGVDVNQFLGGGSAVGGGNTYANGSLTPEAMKMFGGLINAGGMLGGMNDLMMTQAIAMMNEEAAIQDANAPGMAAFRAAQAKNIQQSQQYAEKMDKQGQATSGVEQSKALPTGSVYTFSIGDGGSSADPAQAAADALARVSSATQSANAGAMGALTRGRTGASAGDYQAWINTHDVSDGQPSSVARDFAGGKMQEQASIQASIDAVQARIAAEKSTPGLFSSEATRSGAISNDESQLKQLVAQLAASKAGAQEKQQVELSSASIQAIMKALQSMLTQHSAKGGASSGDPSSAVKALLGIMAPEITSASARGELNIDPRSVRGF